MAKLSLAQGFGEGSHENWLALVDKVLKGADFDQRLISKTGDDIAIAPLYTRSTQPAGEAKTLAARAAAHAQSGGSSYGEGWQICQAHGGDDPKAVNRAILTDLAGGVQSIDLHLAAPGQAGLPVAPAAMVAALNNVDLAICPLTLRAGKNFGAAAAYLLGSWASQKISPEARCGGFNADPLGTLAATGGLGQPLQTALDGAAALVAKTQDLPGVTALIADGRPYHNGGASEAQELASMLATLVAYLRGCEDAGLSALQALPKIAIGLAADQDQFLTIAKLRAARLIIARLGAAIEEGGQTGLAALAGQMKITATTSARMMSRRDPWVNILRTTIACAGAAMGGADRITVLPFTNALGAPDGSARRIARNTQIILQEESALGRVADPGGGAWYVETLTTDLARKAWEFFQQIEAKGGMAAALQLGFVQELIARSAARRQAQYATGRRALTGVSAFARLGADDVRFELFAAAPPVDRTGVQVKALEFARLAAPFERLRDRADLFQDKTGKPPQVFLANLGETAQFSARANWATNFFASGGIEALPTTGFSNSADVGAAFAASGAQAVCLCAADEVYGELGEAVVSLLKTVGARAVYVARRGAATEGALEASLRAAGVDEFIHARCNAIDVLGSVHEALGIGIGVDVGVGADLPGAHN